MEINTVITKTKKALFRLRYPILVIVIGLVLLTIPEKSKMPSSVATNSIAPSIQQSSTTQQLTEILQQIKGVGKVKVLLTISKGEKKEYQTDEDQSADENGSDIRKEPILIYPTLHYQNGGLDITADGMTTNVPNLFVAGEAVGGIHGKNRLMGNSLLDIIVFGRSAGINAAKVSKETTVGKLTLAHVSNFENEIAEAGIETDLVSPKLLPNYTNQKSI